MCGVIGIVGAQNVAPELYDGLTVLQHRGQDAAGISTSNGARLYMHRGKGLVRDVFNKYSMRKLIGHTGIGHCRYPTAGGDEEDGEVQPFYVNSPYGISLGHNGNLVNAEALRKELFEYDHRHINTDSDSEVLLNVLAHALQTQHDHMSHAPERIFNAVAEVHRRVVGGYACVAQIVGYGLLGFRDPHGIRPLVVGKRTTSGKQEYCIASESVALDVLGFELMRDVAPGEAVFVTTDGELHTRQCAKPQIHAPCIFEYVYLARPDSMLENISVYKARLRMGERLGAKILRTWGADDIDSVIPVPDTSSTAASTMAKVLGKPFREGFVKNRYIGRTFIMPGQQQRVKSVQRKLNAIDLEFRNKNVLLVDDSIVRGTTSKQIIQMARDAGAKNVYFASAAPPVRYPNVYGIDMPAAAELVAANRTVKEIEQVLGADKLIYLDLEDLEKAVRGNNTKLKVFDTSCFSGEYVTDVDPAYFSHIETLRSDESKNQRRHAPSPYAGG